GRVPPPPLVNPEIENVVQEDVVQERPDARSLRASPVSLVPLIALQDPGPQPLANEPQDAPIGAPMRHHPQQPFLVDRIEKLRRSAWSTQFTRWLISAVCSA